MPDRIDQQATMNSTDLYAACSSSVVAEQEAAYHVLWVYFVRVALQVVYKEPDATDLAQDCAQIALIRVHERLAECREPRAFRTWARRIVSHVAIDALRRRKRQVALNEDKAGNEKFYNPSENQLLPEPAVLEKIRLAELRNLINLAPISGRSRRVVLGRYLDAVPDESLARVESKLANQEVLPSHIQVTRAKNMAKLRNWPSIRTFLRGGD